MWNITIRDFYFAAVLSVILVTVILLALAVYQCLIEPSRKRRKVSRRLSEGQENYLQRIQILKEGSGEQTGWWLKSLTKLLGEKRLAKLQSLMLQADIYRHPGVFLMWNFILAVLGWLTGTWILGSTSMGIFGCSLGILPYLYIQRKRRIKTKKFEGQMPDAMELLARSLRAGHTLPGAIELLSKEMPDPMGKEMGIAYEEQHFGISTSEALFHMLERVDSLDLRYFVGAVLIQTDTGGNLAELMENIAKVIRSRLNFKSKVRSLTAMGRITTTLMIIAPVLAFFALMVVARDYEKALIETSTGRTMLTVGIVFVFIGAFLLKRMIRAVES
jgi:tight adherence protein B